MLVGVLITDKPVLDYVPLYVNEGTVEAQFIMTTLEELGLLKMDFLGLRTLTVISDTIKFVKQNKGIRNLAIRQYSWSVSVWKSRNDKLYEGAKTRYVRRYNSRSITI